MSRILKLSINHDPTLSSEDILALHIGYLSIHGKVAYSTDTPVARRPKYVLLVLGNVDDVCYLCNVCDYEYFEDNAGVPQKFFDYSPDIYKNIEKRTWFLFDSMQKIPVDFLDDLAPGNPVREFINNRANNKIIGEL